MLYQDYAPTVEVVETIGGRWMVLVNGFQWGGTIDRSGAGSATWKTANEAKRAWREKHER